MMRRRIWRLWICLRSDTTKRIKFRGIKVLGGELRTLVEVWLRDVMVSIARERTTDWLELQLIKNITLPVVLGKKESLHKPTTLILPPRDTQTTQYNHIIVSLFDSRSYILYLARCLWKFSSLSEEGAFLHDWLIAWLINPRFRFRVVDWRD